MPTCPSCRKWSLLADSCSVCVSAGRLLAASTGPRLPPTQEAQFKVTKILDSAFYSIGRLLPEEESPEKGAGAPSEAPDLEEKKGEESPRVPARAKEEEAEASAELLETEANTEETKITPHA